MDDTLPRGYSNIRYPEREQTRERISTAKGLGLIWLALMVDATEMALELLGIGLFGLSTLISLCATTVFWILFKLCDVKFTGKPKNFLKFGATAILEMVPGLDALFGFVWTVGIFTLVASTMEEDGQSGIIVKVYQFTLKKIGL